MGRKNRPFYRLVASDARFPRDGKSIEILGHYDPLIEDEEKNLTVREDRVRYWLSVGATPSLTVTNLLKRRGITLKKHEKRDRSGRKKSRALKASKK